MGTWSEPVRRYFFVGRDMTESRRAQEALRESEQLARGIADIALDAFYQIDERGNILSWNGQAETMSGWPRCGSAREEPARFDFCRRGTR